MKRYLTQKNIIIIISFLICVSVTLINFILNNKKSININSDGLAIYVYNGSSFVANNSIPTGAYKLNTELSYCTGGSEINNYNSTTGTISYSFIESSRCFSYFDIFYGEITDIVVHEFTITATINMGNGVSSFGLSTSNTVEPTSWLTSDDNGTISGTSWNLKYTASVEGTYYLWAKDANGNKIKSEGNYEFKNADPLYEYITALVDTNSSNTSNMVYQDDFGNTRYAGPSSSVLNYICLDQTTESDGACSTDGLYRIIGVTTTNSSYTSTSTGQNYIKVIKSTSYASTAWNSSSSNNWSTASLNTTTLNGTYLTSLNTQLGSKASLIVDTTWWLYGQTGANYTPINMYKVERNIDSSGAVYSGNPTTSTGKIGLMYPSDYGYASSNCSQTLYNYENSTCKANNWMTGSSTADWFITPKSSSSSYAYAMSSSSSPWVTTTSVTSSKNVRPVLYLSTDAYYESGDGSSSNPYRFN